MAFRGAEYRFKQSGALFDHLHSHRWQRFVFKARLNRALGWSSADYIQIHCGALCAD
jgi:hypothetical protein